MTLPLIASTKIAAPSTVTPGIDTTGANVIVIVQTASISAASAPSDNKSNSYSAIGTEATDGSSGYVTNWICVNPTVGSGHTFTTPGPLGTIVVSAWNLPNTTSLDDVANHNNTQSTGGTTGSITPTQDGDLIIAGLGGHALGTPACAGYTLVDSANSVPATSFSAAMAYLVQTSAGATNPAWTWPDGDVAGLKIISLKAGFSSALAAGTLSANATGTTTISVDGGTITGGTAPYSAQLKISLTSGSGYSDYGSPITGDDTPDWSVTGLTPDTEYFFKYEVTDNVAATSTSNEDSDTTGVVSPFVAGTTIGGSGTSSPGIDTTGADLIVIQTVEFNATPPTPTDNKSNTYLPLGNQQSASGSFIRTRTFYCKNPNVGTGHTFTISGTAVSAAVGAFTGRDLASPLDQTNGGDNKTTGGTPGSITPTHDDELVITGAGGGFASDVAVAGYTIAAQIDDTPGSWIGAALAYKLQTAATATNPAWTFTGGGQAGLTIQSFEATNPGLDGGTLAATSSSGSSVSLLCSGITGGTAPYGSQLQRSLALAGSWSNIGSPQSGTDPTFTDSTVSEGVFYDYRVIVTDNVSATATSNTVLVSTLTLFSVPPIRYSGNPVIVEGGSGTWNETQTFDTRIIPDPHNAGHYLMFVSGQAAGGGFGVGSIGLYHGVEGGDGEIVWTEYGGAGNGQIMASIGGWEATSIRLGDVEYDEDNDLIYLYYTGDTAGSAGKFGVATAPGTAPQTMTRYGGNPILEATGDEGDIVGEPDVLREGSNLTMIYSYRLTGAGLPLNFRSATSTDFVTWTKTGDGDRLLPKPDGTAFLGTEAHHLSKIGNVYVLVFESGSPAVAYSVNVAIAPSAGGPFVPLSEQLPLVGPSGLTSDWEQYAVATPFLHLHNGTYKLYYTGSQSNTFYPGPWEMGFASFDGAFEAVLSDGFSGTNGTTITGRTPDTIGAMTWAAVTGTFYVQSNTAQPNSHADADKIVVDVGESDYVLECDVVQQGTAGDESTTGILVRYSDSTHWWLVKCSLSTIKLYENTGSGATERASSSFSPVAGTANNLSITCIGATITVRVDGVESLVWTGALTNVTATKVGLYAVKAGTPPARASWDNFLVQRVVLADLTPTLSLTPTAVNTGTTAMSGSGTNNAWLSVPPVLTTDSGSFSNLVVSGDNAFTVDFTSVGATATVTDTSTGAADTIAVAAATAYTAVTASRAYEGQTRAIVLQANGLTTATVTITDGGADTTIDDATPELNNTTPVVVHITYNDFTDSPVTLHFASSLDDPADKVVTLTEFPQNDTGANMRRLLRP